MNYKNTRRGNTQNSINKNCHSRVPLSGIYSFFNNTQGGDPRQKPSGMTIDFTTARGFTLIELLVVVLIIGILAAVAVPQYQRVTLKSRVASVLSMGRAVQVAQEVYYFENGVYTDTMDKLDIEGKCPPGWKCRLHTDRLVIQNDDNTFGINFAYEHAPQQLVAGKIFCWANKKNNDLLLNLCRSYGSDLGGNPDRYMAEIVQ